MVSVLATLPQEQQNKIQQHVDLLVSWNQAFNLTAIKSRDDMLVKHVEDSLLVLPYIQGAASILDVGSGAGFPGVPLAIASPKARFTLLDSNGKKTRFLLQVKMTLGLANVGVSQERVEHLKVSEPFDIIMCRAFSELALFHTLCSHLASHNTLFLAMKGKLDPQELNALRPLVQSLQVHVLPDLGIGQRHLVEWKLA